MNRRELVHSFVLNVEKARTNMSLTQGQMAGKLGMSLSGYKKLVSEETTKIDVYLCYLVQKMTGRWMFEFIGDKDGQDELAEKIRSLTLSQRNFVAEIVDFEAAFTPEAGEKDDYISVLVFTGDFEDGMIYDSSNVIKVNAAPYRRIFGAGLHCGIKVTSNHLHPVYNTGDILLVCRRAIHDGDTGIFIHRKTHRAYIRKYYQTNPCRLEPVNDLGETLYVDGNDREDMNQWIIFGYVLTKMRGAGK